MASAEPPHTAPLGTGTGTGTGMVCCPHTSAGPWGEEGGGQGAAGHVLHPHPAQGAGPAALQLLVSSIDRAVSVPFPGGSGKPSLLPLGRCSPLG